MEGFGRGNVTW